MRRAMIAMMASTLMAGCNGDGACKADADCAAGQRCAQGTCQAAPTASAAPDEDDPKTHVARLGDAGKRDAAIGWLLRRWEGALAQDRGNPKGPASRELLGVAAGPLAAIAKRAKLPPKRQAEVLKMLAESRDPAAKEALVEAIRIHRVDDKQPTPVDKVMGEVIAAATELGLEETAPQLWSLFQALQASSRKAEVGGFAPSLGSAVARLADPAWESKAAELLAGPLDPEGDLKRFRDQLFWQRTSARVLGRLRSPSAAEALFRVTLDPQKHDVGPDALSALTEIGPPAAALATKILAGEHEALLAHAKDRYGNAREKDVADVVDRGEEDYRITAATQALASVGRQADEAAVLDGLKRADPIGRGRIAELLVALPASEATLEAYRNLTEKSALDLPISPAHRGVVALYVLMPAWFEPSLTPWLAKLAAGLPGSDTGLAPFREAALRACMLAMTKDQVEAVKALADLITETKWKKEWGEATAALDSCGEDAACWLKRARETPGAKADFIALKAARMAAAHARPSQSGDLVKAVEEIRAVTSRRMLLRGLLRLHPQGDAALADRLDAILAGSRDAESARLVARLRNRAGS